MAFEPNPRYRFQRSARRSFAWIVAAGLMMFVSCEAPRSGDQGTDTTTGDSTAQLNPEQSVNSRIKDNPNDPDLYYERARLHVQKGETEEAIADLNRSLNLDSAKCEYHLLLADIYLSQNRSRDTRNALNKCLALNKENTEALLKLGELYFLVRDYDKALENVDEALKVDVYLAKAYYMKGRIFMESGDTVKAVSSFYTCIEQDDQYYDAHLQLGYLYGLEDDPLAVSHYDNAIGVRPTSIEAHYSKALFQQAHDRPEDALTEYGIILKIDPDYFLAHFNIGYVQMIYLEEFEAAVENFTKAIAYAPDKYFEAYYNRGYAYELMEDKVRAEQDFRQALAIKPDYDLAAKGISRVVDGDYR